MDTFSKLFGNLLALVYHCFDRIVIQGYLPLLTREEHIVHFFRDVHGIYPITKEALRARTTEYQQWVEAFARTHRIPMEWPDTQALKAKGLKKEDYVRPYYARLERQQRFGVYFICIRDRNVGPCSMLLKMKYTPNLCAWSGSNGSGCISFSTAWNRGPRFCPGCRSSPPRIPITAS